ncbi:MAG: hypothetical protein IT378_15545, partial [Sandaracinaceae bacterium]|nr:hypothetical protein [Sandaracinaceae bacterium]
MPLDSAAARRWLGGKGAGLAEMTRMGLPVPPGFTLTTQVWRHWNQHGSLPDGLREAVLAEVARLEELTGLRFGDMSGRGGPLAGSTTLEGHRDRRRAQGRRADGLEAD